MSLKNLTRKFVADESGALVTEYGMLIVVVVIAMASVLVAFRRRISSWFDTIATELPNKNTT